MVNRARSWGGWLRSPRHLRAGAGLLVGVARAQGVPGLVPVHWYVEPGLGVSGFRVLCILKLVSAHWHGFQGHWLRSPRCPRAGVGLPVGRVMVCGVPRATLCLLMFQLTRQAVELW